MIASLTLNLGEVSSGANTIRQLTKHSEGGDQHSTYGYYFTEEYHAEENYSFWTVPDWAKNSADHSDDLIFMFGGIHCKKDYSKILSG